MARRDETADTSRTPMARERSAFMTEIDTSPSNQGSEAEMDAAAGRRMAAMTRGWADKEAFEN